MPLIEVLVVSELDLAVCPLVERLVHHQEAQPIAQIEELGRGRVVRGADRVDAHFLEQFQTARPHGFGHGGSDRAAGVVQVYPQHLHPLAVEQESAIRVEGDVPDPEGGRRLVRQLAAGLEHGRTEGVESRGLQGPQGRRFDRQPLREGRLLPGGEREGRHGPRHLASRGVEDHRHYLTSPDGLPVVGEPRTNLQRCPLGGHVGCGHEGAPLGHVQGVGDREPHVPVDSATRVPARVGLVRVVHPDGDDVLSLYQVRRQVVGEADVAVRAVSQVLPVHPHVAVLEHPVELDRDPPAIRSFRQREQAPVPAHAGGQVAAPSGRGGVLVVRPFDAPVVRQVHLPPAGVVERGRLGAGHITRGERPPEVGQQPVARGVGLLGRGRGGEDARHEDDQSGRPDQTHAAHVWLLTELEVVAIPGLCSPRF